MSARRVTDELSKDEAKLQLTPMIDVSFLILIFFMCLPFKTLEGKLQAFLPTDKGINPTPQEPPNEIKVQVHIVARQHEEVPWGRDNAKYMVEMPTEVAYRMGQQETKELGTVAEWITEARRQAEGTEATVKGEIKAAHKVPHKFVVAVLNKFQEAGLEKVDFYGTAIPPAQLRREQFLPYPTGNYVGVTD